MAKPGKKGVFEQHAEKIVLGVCALIFLISLAAYIPGSGTTEVPTGRGAGTTKVPYDKVDEHLKQVSEEVWEQAQESDADVTKLPDYLAMQRRYQRRPFSPALTMNDMGSGKLPVDRDYVPTITPEAELAKLVPLIPEPNRLFFWAGRLLPKMDKEEDLEDEIVTHVGAQWQRGLCLKRWEEALRRTTIIDVPVVVLGVEVEVQQQLDDGSWVKADGVKVVFRNEEPVEEGKEAPEAPKVPDIPAPDGTNDQEVDDAVMEISSMDWQKRLQMPEYWDIYHPSGEWLSWLINLPREALTDLPEGEVERTGRTTRNLYTRRDTRVRIRESERPTRSSGAPRRTPTRRRSSGPPPDALRRMEEAQREMQEMMMRESDRSRTPSRDTSRRREPERRSTPPGPSEPKPREEIELPQPLPVPDVAAQIDAGRLLLWKHLSSLESGKTYRCRFRLKLLNPLLGRADEVKQAADAKVLSVYTPFSDWSGDIAVRRDTEFFVTGTSDEFVQVTVFAHALGQRVSESFSVRPGERIGEVLRKVQVRNPLAMKVVEREVDFATGAVAVALAKMRALKGKGPYLTDLRGMVCLEEDGKLRTRMRKHDVDSERYKKLDREVSQTREAVREAGEQEEAERERQSRAGA